MAPCSASGSFQLRKYGGWITSGSTTNRLPLCCFSSSSRGRVWRLPMVRSLVGSMPKCRPPPWRPMLPSRNRAAHNSGQAYMLHKQGDMSSLEHSRRASESLPYWFAGNIYNTLILTKYYIAMRTLYIFRHAALIMFWSAFAWCLVPDAWSKKLGMKCTCTTPSVPPSLPPINMFCALQLVLIHVRSGHPHNVIICSVRPVRSVRAA